MFCQVNEGTGKLMDYWDNLKRFAVYSDRIMTQIFGFIHEETIKYKISAEDLDIIHNGLCKGMLALISEPHARTVFLRCYVSTPNKTSRHLLDLLRDWSDLTVVPVEAVVKLLTTMDMGDALKTLNVLQRIPTDT